MCIKDGANRARRFGVVSPMRIFRSRAAVSLAALAALTMTASPALAHGRDGWRYRHHRGGGIDGGDVLAGVLVIGGIAAIMSAASKKDKDAEQAQPNRYPGGPQADEQGYGDEPAEPEYGARDGDVDQVPADADADADADRGTARGSFDGAVDACSAALDRSERQLDTVENVRRMGGRYSVEGRLQDGHDYACSVDDGGTVRSVAVDGQAMI